VTFATLSAALALTSVSAAFSIDGLTAILGSAFWPVIAMGMALEVGKLVATPARDGRRDYLGRIPA
jgi:hypothetical protein